MDTLTVPQQYMTSLALVPAWFGVYSLFQKVIKCPEQLKPENNKGNTRKYHQFYNNFPSILHATMQVILAAIYGLTVGFSHGQANDLFGILIIANSLAYFIYDTIAAETWLKPDLAMRFHHVAGIGVLGSVFYTQTGVSECTCALLLAELSNPFNLYRDIMRARGQENSDLFFKISLTFAFLFIFTRFMIIPMWLPTLYPGPTHLCIKIFCGVIWFVSWHWLFIIINLATKAFKQRQKTSEMTAWERLYQFFFKLRNSKTFMASYYVVAAYACFVTLYISHGQKME